MDSLPAEPQGSPRILEWVAYPFSSGSSHLRKRTGLLHYRWILYQLSYLSGKPNTNLELGGECSNGFLSDQSVPTNIFAGFLFCFVLFCFVLFFAGGGWLLTLPSAITFTSCVPYHTSSNQSCYCDWPRGDPMHTTSNAPGTRDWRKDYTSRPQHMRTSDWGPTQ